MLARFFRKEANESIFNKALQSYKKRSCHGIPWYETKTHDNVTLKDRFLTSAKEETGKMYYSEFRE
jgi:hypothetical protein